MDFTNTKVIAQIQKAGWHEGRSLEGKIGFSYEDTPQFIKEFLYQYAELKIERVLHPSLKGKAEIHLFSEMEPEDLTGDNDYPYYQGIIGKKLYPIGLYIPDGYYICCDVDGRVYKIGEYCFYVGKNLYEGIENIILMNTLQSLQLDEDTGKWWNMDGDYVSLPSLD